MEDDVSAPFASMIAWRRLPWPALFRFASVTEQATQRPRVPEATVAPGGCVIGS